MASENSPLINAGLDRINRIVRIFLSRSPFTLFSQRGLGNFESSFIGSLYKSILSIL